jgi:hypothetical protein
LSSESGSRQRRILFRLAAIVIGLSPLLVLEVLFRVLGIFAHSDADDPFVGFASVHPLFTLDEGGERYETARDRRRFFKPVSFLARKPQDGYRIFVLGGSTVQGNPWGPQTAFPSWLELSLEAADRSRQWEVVNCGGISYASYRLVPILLETRAYEPDLYVIYSGQNEFLEDRTYRTVKETPQWAIEAHARMTSFRTYNAARTAFLSLTSPKPEGEKSRLGDEVVARLDFFQGLAQYHRDDDWKRGVVAHYEASLARMASIADAAGVPIVFMNPVVNLADTRPFKSEWRSGIERVERDRFIDRWKRANEPDLDPIVRERLLRGLLAVDDRHAMVHFDLGAALQAQGRFPEAKAEYLRAKEEDVCPLRILEPMRDALARVADRADAPLLDAQALFESLSPNGLTGSGWLVDHVHPTIEGQKRLAGLLFDELVRQGIVGVPAEFSMRRDALFERRMASLDAKYLRDGEAHLANLHEWTQGRSMVRRPPR